MNRVNNLVKKCLRAVIVTVVLLESLMIISTFFISLICSTFSSNSFRDMYNIVDPGLQIGLLILSVFIGTISGFIIMWREDYKSSQVSRK